MSEAEIPQGWRLVPEELTEAMIAAGAREADDYVDHSPNGPRSGSKAAKWVWRAMLAAFPPPPVQEKDRG